MIIGDKKEAVIDNIKNAVEQNEFNVKVEVNDPNLTNEQKTEIIDKYLNKRKSLSYKRNNRIVRFLIKLVALSQNKEIKVEGLENVKDIKTGAIITCNHFNPLDNMAVRKMARRAKKRRLYIVGQEENLAMEGILGYFMNYADIIPISNKISYMKESFPNIIKEILDKKNFILIYPEQEMWFNYKKPRPLKPGAYYYAAKNNVPIISCFNRND